MIDGAKHRVRRHFFRNTKKRILQRILEIEKKRIQKKTT